MNYIYLLCRKQWQAAHMRRYKKIVHQANQLESSLTSLSDEELVEKVRDLHDRAQTLKKITPLLPMALALGREKSKRIMGMRHYDVQLIGTLALFEGNIAEMDTGEGKTLMAPLAAFLHQLGHVDRCTHIVTANEYLAARDAKWMAPLLNALGMNVGLIVPGQNNAVRAHAYQQDVVYATAKEIVFDSLREPVRQKKTSVVDAILRPNTELELNPKYDFAIIDEVDSVLIDQARSPLSIGGESTVSAQLDLYKHAFRVAGQLVRGTHYRLTNEERSIELKDEGKAEARKHAGSALRLLPTGHKWERYITCALAARYIYKNDQHYVVRDNKIVLIDESTGRLLPGRQLPDGIHQALEVQNGLEPTAELRGNYMTTFQTYFRKYDKLAGMTGTASLASWEFNTVYDLCSIPIPTNRPSKRKIWPDKVYRNIKSKYIAIVKQIEEVHATGRPILIGCGTIQVSELLSQLLTSRELPHEVLNAKNHTREAEIIEQAGQKGRITLITNMAGRGVDIKLGDGIAELGGMYLMSTDRLHYRRLDLQLTGRAGRQGDPADCQFFLSLKDDLMRHGDKKKICMLRKQTRNTKYDAIPSIKAEQLFDKVQKHLDKASAKQRHRVFQGEKHREKMKDQGLWEDWMDLR